MSQIIYVLQMSLKQRTGDCFGSIHIRMLWECILNVFASWEKFACLWSVSGSSVNFLKYVTSRNQ